MKDLLKSKTFWGGIAQAGALAANAFGVPLTESMIMGAVGLGFTIYGRIAAENGIDSVAGVTIKKVKK